MPNTRYSSAGMVAAMLAPVLLINVKLSGDAMIYATFFKNFFTLPFSYQSDTVTFGATSPLHVLINALLLEFSPIGWMIPARVLAITLLGYGTLILKKSLQLSWFELGLVVITVLAHKALIETSLQYYETALAYAMISTAYCLIKAGRETGGLLLSGSLYLVRPELILVTILVALFAFSGNKDRARLMLVIALSLLPVVIYHSYMFVMTKQLFPSSVAARMLTAGEAKESWLDSLVISGQSLVVMNGLVPALGVVSLGYLIHKKGVRTMFLEASFFLPLVLLYILFPPRGYTARYLIPILPLAGILVIMAIRTATVAWRSQYAWLGRARKLKAMIGVVLFWGLALSQYTYGATRDNLVEDRDLLCLKDCAEILNNMSSSDDGVLIYEIQGQFYIHARCISLDGIVGGQVLNYLAGTQSLSSLLRDHKIRFIVTVNAFKYRRIYDGSFLQQLYDIDLDLGTGDTVTLGNSTLRKAFTNPVFDNPNLYAETPFEGLDNHHTLRLFGKWADRWKGHHPFWNSVFEIIAVGDSAEEVSSDSHPQGMIFDPGGLDGTKGKSADTVISQLYAPNIITPQAEK